MYSRMASGSSVIWERMQISPSVPRNLNLNSLAERLKKLGEVRTNDYLLRFQSSGYDLTVFGDGRAIVKGTHDLSVARSLYARYFGS